MIKLISSKSGESLKNSNGKFLKFKKSEKTFKEIVLCKKKIEEQHQNHLETISKPTLVPSSSTKPTT
jgi:hypothetical protein